jgi:glutamyl-tRNA reductase
VTARLSALVAHARFVPAGDRALLGARLREPAIDGALLVETCHRVELVGREHDVARAAVERGIELRPLAHDETVRHVVRLAVGLESAVVGEDQILHQLRGAARDARREGRLDRGLDHLLDLALRAGRQARTWLPAKRPTLADVALDVALGTTPGSEAARPERAEQRPLAGPVLVVGAGPMGRLLAASARSRGLSVLVASRTASSAERLAAGSGARAVSFDPGPAEAGSVGAVLVALGGRWSIAASTAEALARSQARIVDVSSPEAIEPHLADRLGSRLTSIDDLVSGPGPGESALRDRLEALVDSTVAAWEAWTQAEIDRSLASALVDRASDLRAAELDALWQRMPDLDGSIRVEIERMAAQLTGRLLRDPLERLGEDVDGRHGRAAQELFRL